MKGYIYRHSIKINGKVFSYIGQTIQEPKKRWLDGWGYFTNETKNKFCKAIVKYGWDNFKHEIIKTVNCSNEKDLKQKLNLLEKQYIEKYDSIDNGFNTKEGNQKTSKCKKHKKQIKKEVIVCITTGERFDTLSSAARYCNLKGTKEIRKCINGEVYSAGKHPITGEKLVWTIEGKKSETRKKEYKYVCLNDGSKFFSYKEISEKYNISQTTISHIINNKIEVKYNNEKLMIKKIE